MKAAQKIETFQPVLEYGVITGCCERGFLVNCDRGLVDADVAVSCIVSPEAGDVVLFSLGEPGYCHILSILERPERTHRRTELSFEGDLSVNVRGGVMSLTGEESISLASREFILDAHNGKVNVEKLSFFGRLVENHVSKIKVVAEALDSTIRRAVQRFTSSYRYVEEHEETQSASTRMIVDGTLTMHTKNTMHIAEGHVKIDAEQIHLG